MRRFGPTRNTPTASGNGYYPRRGKNSGGGGSVQSSITRCSATWRRVRKNLSPTIEAAAWNMVGTATRSGKKEFYDTRTHPGGRRETACGDVRAQMAQSEKPVFRGPYL